MTEQFSVNTTSLNLRSTPASDDPSNIIASLPNGQIVTRLEGTLSDKWWKVTAITGGTPLTGFVNHDFLLFLVTPLEEIVTNGQILALDAVKANQQLVLQVQKRLRNLGLYPGGHLIDGDLGPRTVKSLNRFCEFVGLSVTTDQDMLNPTLAKELLEKPQIASILDEAKDTSKILGQIKEVQDNFQNRKLGERAYLDRGIKNSPLELEVKNYPARLSQKPDGISVISYGQTFQPQGSGIPVTFSDYPSQGNRPDPKIDGEGLTFLDESIEHACVCVGSFVPGDDEIKTHWLGKKSLVPKQFLSATKFIGVLNTICQLNKAHPSCDVDNCRISGSAGERYNFYSLVEDMVTYAGDDGLGNRATSNRIAAMFKRFSTREGLEKWTRSITGNQELSFRGYYGADSPPLIDSPVLLDTTLANSNNVVLRSPDETGNVSNNLLSAYDLVRLISMLGWHQYLADEAKLPDAQWTNLESVARAMGLDPARYVDVALETLGLVNVISEPVVISKLGLNPGEGEQKLTYVALVKLVDNRQVPSKLRTLAMALWTEKDKNNIAQDNYMAAAVTEIIRRVFTEELA